MIPELQNLIDEKLNFFRASGGDPLIYRLKQHYYQIFSAQAEVIPKFLLALLNSVHFFRASGGDPITSKAEKFSTHFFRASGGDPWSLVNDGTSTIFFPRKRR